MDRPSLKQLALDGEAAGGNIIYSLPDKHNRIAIRRPRARTTVNDLPHDVLLIILRDVHRATLRPFNHMADMGFERESNHQPELDPPAPYHSRLSPCSQHSVEHIASVSPHWLEAMSNSSEFWTQLVIWTGRDATPLSMVRKYLAGSRDKPLSIHVWRRYDPCVEDRTEKAHVKAIVELLVPHMKRTKLLCMHLLHSSSLPLPHTDLVGRAENLVQLKLEFIFDDAVARPAPLPPSERTFDTPALLQLSIGGVHFREAYVAPVPRPLFPPKLRWITITDYTSDQVPFPAVALLETLTVPDGCPRRCTGNLRANLTNLQLDSYSDADPPRLNGQNIDWYFTDMSGDVIAHLSSHLDYPSVETLSYTRCTTSTYNHPTLCNSYYLTLEGIPDSATLRYYMFGNFISIRDCDGFNSEVLRALARPVSGPYSNAESWVCPEMDALSISGCKRFHSSELRAALEARRRRHEETGFAEVEDFYRGYMLLSVTHLYVRDCGELAAEDREWFDNNVEEVHWDDWYGGTGDDDADDDDDEEF
ncbi:hypothetical protein EVJ58_g6094 [Rhodofomes roseus]|uniref:F-box domain-containing protein n=1 Tax=Rhodofomes roseus TaxID=34475 RepID=A0A4Y9YB41_9APHY|nr:hypothetical protein EVJ58_g6094 [Rhodofomes roseus]